MNKNIRQSLIKFTTFIGGFYFFTVFALGGLYSGVAEPLGLPTSLEPYSFKEVHQEILKSLVIIGTMAFGLGIINIVRVHGVRIAKQQRGWLNSFALLLGMTLVFGIELTDLVVAERKTQQWEQIDSIITYVEREKNNFSNDMVVKQATLDALTGLIQQAKSKERFLKLPEDSLIASQHEEFTSTLETLSSRNAAELEAEQVLDSLRALRGLAREITESNYEATSAKQWSSFVYKGLFIPLASSMFALLAFYIASAAYRSFRVKSVEAFIMMVAALVVILGQIPQGPKYISSHLPEIRLWLIQNLSNPAFRAIYFGSAIAGLAMAVRMWLSLEKSPLAVEEEDA